ncbi:MAG: class I SAM-dependent rRNA methyltransferase [Chloroflexota bacterium]|nr:class I SAM-dependent methyltransferase [Chloroflexota bacterium]MBI5703156.1 class I SAM-dependent methyltransferase [Chloroflexota bacterium]
MADLILKPGREKSLLRRHPWIFSGAIHHLDEEPASGSTVNLLSADGHFLARASYSPASQIRARVWTFTDEPVDREFFRKRIRAAIEMRRRLNVESDADSYRLIYAESDSLPGLIVDRYGEVLVLQSLTAGAEYWKDTLASLLLEETGLAILYERSDADVRELEGLQPKVGLLSGENYQLPITITEHNLRFLVNLQTGHKTGFYLDQRNNRLRVRELAKDRDVLDCFCYTGGFTVNALAGGAKSVLSVDSSAEALELCKENIALNDLPVSRHTALEGDVFQLLRKFRDENRSFDLIILDPPKFAPTAAHAEKAARAYKDINLLAFKLLRPGGILVTFSCSGGVDAGLFQKIVAGAALDAGVEAQVVEWLSQAADHPVSLHFPESAYLKGLVCIKQRPEG